MSQVLDFSGENSFFLGGSILSNPKDSSLFLSLGHQVDVCFPASKRSRVNASYVFSGEQKKPSIEVLPDECLFEVFRCLSGSEEKSVSACVSKRWLSLLSTIRADEVCNKEDLGSAEPEAISAATQAVVSSAENKKEDIEADMMVEDVTLIEDGYLTRCLEGKKATDVRLAAIAIGTGSRGGLGKLSIRGSNSSRGVTDFGLKAIARQCSSLKVLSLWNLSAITDEGLIEIANGCPRLEKLDLSRCPGVTDKALVAIAKSCSNLASLTLESCSNIGNGSLEAVGQYCPELKSVVIKNCACIGDNGIVSLFTKAGNVLTKARIEMLNITDVSLAVIGRYGNALTELALTNLQNVNERGFWIMGNCQGLLNLKSIVVTACQGVTDVGLEALAKGCPSLKRVCLKKCAFVSDNGLVALSKAAALLVALQVEECHRITQAGILGMIVHSDGKLKALSLSNCLGFKDFPFFGLHFVRACSSLKSLSVHNCPGFGNGCLAILAKLCPSLAQIELTASACITDEGLAPLLENNEAGFVKVNLNGCVNLTDRVASALARLHGSTLEELNLDGCRNLTDATLFAISEHCSLLTELDVSKSKISDKGLAALAEADQFCLRVLSLSGCSYVSNRSLPSLKKLGKALTGLNIQHCRGISSGAADVLEEFLFKCDILS